MCDAPFDRFCGGYDGGGLSAENETQLTKYQQNNKLEKLLDSGDENDASTLPPNQSSAHVTLTFDLLHLSSYDTMDIYRNRSLPRLVKIRRTVLEA